MSEQETTARGFRIYHKCKDAYGGDVAIVESSASEPGIWIQFHTNAEDQIPTRLDCSFLLHAEDMMDFGLALMQAAQEKRHDG